MSKKDLGMTEEELLQKAAAGTREAYGQIFKLHRDRAYGLAFHYTKNKEDAMDVVQDAFMRAYLNLNKFDFRRKFRPWLLSIVRNLAIDLLRRRKRTHTDELPAVLPERSDQTTHADRKLLRREIRDLMNELSEQKREIIFLKDYQGHSYTEIAEIMDIPLGTVMSRLHHARKKLVALLKDRRNA